MAINPRQLVRRLVFSTTFLVLLISLLGASLTLAPLSFQAVADTNLDASNADSDNYVQGLISSAYSALESLEEQSSSYSQIETSIQEQELERLNSESISVFNILLQAYYFTDRQYSYPANTLDLYWFLSYQCEVRESPPYFAAGKPPSLMVLRYGIPSDGELKAGTVYYVPARQDEGSATKAVGYWIVLIGERPAGLTWDAVMPEYPRLTKPEWALPARCLIVQYWGSVPKIPAYHKGNGS